MVAGFPFTMDIGVSVTQSLLHLDAHIFSGNIGGNLSWLNSNRRDAILARQVGIHFTTKLCDELRSRASEQNGHGVAAMCGGIQTDAHWAPGGALRDYCRDCQGAFTPCTDHILWFCRHIGVKLGPCRVLGVISLVVRGGT